jgi:hypothetical protein
VRSFRGRGSDIGSDSEELDGEGGDSERKNKAGEMGSQGRKEGEIERILDRAEAIAQCVIEQQCTLGACFCFFLSKNEHLKRREINEKTGSIPLSNVTLLWSSTKAYFSSPRVRS